MKEKKNKTKQNKNKTKQNKTKQNKKTLKFRADARKVRLGSEVELAQTSGCHVEVPKIK